MGTNASKSKENTRHYRVDKRRQPPPTPPSPHHTLSANPHVETIPTVFRWSFGGNHVYISGTFNQWKERIFMSRDRDGFAIILNLPVGRYHYKYIVDDEWRLDPQMPTEQDSAGHVNNVIDVVDVSKFAEVDDTEASEYDEFGADYTSPETRWEENRKVPPLLPSQLYFTTLSSTRNNPTLLAIPLHVTINHLYFGRPSAIGSTESIESPNDAHLPSLPPPQQQQHRVITSSSSMPAVTKSKTAADRRKSQPQPTQPAQQPIPERATLVPQQAQHVRAIHPPLRTTEDSVNVVGVTERYRNKYGTVLLYRPFKDPITNLAETAASPIDFDFTDSSSDEQSLISNKTREASAANAATSS